MTDLLVTPQQLIDEAQAVAARLTSDKATLTLGNLSIDCHVLGVKLRQGPTGNVWLTLEIVTNGAPRYT